MTGIALRPLVLGRDLDLVHGWMNQPHVIPWWHLDGPRERTRDYLAGQLAVTHLDVWIATDDGVPLAYVETYRAVEDELAGYFEAYPGDRGFHLLVGPPERLGTGAARRLLAHLLAWLWSLPDTTRVLCEPNERNARMLGLCRAMGGVPAGTFQHHERRAVLMTWSAPA